ncbi:MAG: Asp-tRNA(Asn)/Glu-tRNA(Gln) amidotransferase subunit GatB [Alphaproteobacteria bacterium]|jgi:aspartyl-tRNA(Asn)/glutamyl-tRNA(Gln) amidotransferase subunit B|nr:Asp-tRNA(Asn)/Glu-tRNA(Gln) amidotransferase subunit GatB [Alphaproteobacteria bacterium]MDP6819598.1 Asp-tRNA(Asn)/Glu-tRNA(Gln) amidotransferase subunit GatB [Alphaproteobacteria bacterium]
MSEYRVTGESGEWEMIVGLEIHAQVISNAKLFSAAPTNFGAEANTQVSLVDAAMPGMLPVINGECVRQAVRTGLALAAEINLYSVFDRKNYFYPDLPPGYQISQFNQPIVGHGKIEIDLKNGETREIGITRLHLEMDAGKSIHDMRPDATFVDLNRAGVALMEIVSEPDIRSPEEAGAYIRKIRSILRYIGSCDGNMDQGSLRCDANVSVRRPGAELGTRSEIKNVNSVRFVMKALEYEAVRQVEIIEAGGEIDQETRLFDANQGVTRGMRSKEEAHDYRYFPDPDLLPLELDAAWVEELRRDLPELPDAKKHRFMTEHGLGAYDSGVLVGDKETAEYFEQVAAGRDGKLAANWVTGELFAALNAAGLEISDSPVSAARLGGLVDRVADKTLSRRIAKEVFEIMFESGGEADAIISARGLKQVSDSGAIEAVVDRIIADNPDKVAEYRGGKDKLMGWFVGQVMKASQGKANPQMANEVLSRKLSG